MFDSSKSISTYVESWPVSFARDAVLTSMNASRRPTETIHKTHSILRIASLTSTRNFTQYGIIGGQSCWKACFQKRMFSIPDSDSLLTSRPSAHRTPDERYHVLNSDLRLTTLYLKIHPKVYWIWTHRKWCLEHVPDGPGRRTETDGQQVQVNGHSSDTPAMSAEHEVDRDDSQTPKPTTSTANADAEENDAEGWKKEAWGRELLLVEKMLEADSRNCKSAPCVVERIRFNSTLSSRMGLPALRALLPASNFPSSKDTRNGD